MQVLNSIDIAEYLSEYLVRDQIIEKQRQQLYIFGINQMIDMLINLVTIFFIGICFHMLPEIFLFAVVYIAIRCYAGGYHARTRSRCYVCSVLMYLFALAIIFILNNYLLINLAIAMVGGAIIFIMAPVEHKNKPLRENERRVYRQRARIFTSCGLLIAIMATIANISMITAVVATAFLALSVMLIVGTVAK